MKTLNPLIYLTLFLTIGLVGKVSAEAGDQLCYPGDNITDSKLDLKFKTIRKPTLDFLEFYWPYVRSLASEILFGKIEYPETWWTKVGNHYRTETNAKQHCHPFTHELSDLLMNEYQFSLMRIVSDVEIIDGNPWWCKDFGTLNHPQPLFADWTHVCYPKDWTDGIGKFKCNLEHWDQIILRSEKEPTWRCIPFEFWCPNKDIEKYDAFINIFAIFFFYGLLILLFKLMIKGTELLFTVILIPVFNRFVLYGTWTAPQPVIGPILPMFWPKPAPAA